MPWRLQWQDAEDTGCTYECGAYETYGQAIAAIPAMRRHLLAEMPDAVARAEIAAGHFYAHQVKDDDSE